MWDAAAIECQLSLADRSAAALNVAHCPCRDFRALGQARLGQADRQAMALEQYDAHGSHVPTGNGR